MAKWGSADFKQLAELQKRLEKLINSGNWDKFCRETAQELAKILYATVVKRTPVGQYVKGSGKQGGTLRRGWKVSGVTKSGIVYTIEVYNDTHYAMYVEFGHRTRNHKGWVPGQFMMTISESQLRTEAPKIIEKRIQKYLQGVFDG